MAQIKKGTTYDSGNNRLVTPTNLNNLVENAVLYKGSITEQSSLVGSETVASNDQILISNTSDSAGLYPTKVTLGAVLSAGIPITTEQLNVTTNINAGIIHTDTLLVGDAMSETVPTDIVLTVLGNTQCGASGFTGIAAGDNDARQDPLTASAIRWNNEEEWLEVWSGTEWIQVGYSPFEASGGNIIIEPSDVEVAAQFSSANGIDFTVTVAAGHDINMGQMVEIKTTTPSYSGTYIPVSVNQFTVVLKRTGTAAAPVSGVSCTIRKTGDHKIHIFKNSGNFIVGDEIARNAEVLVVAGGAGSGSAQSGMEDYVAGGGGGVSYARNVILLPNTTYSVVVGQGGVAGITVSSVGGNSSFSGTNITLSATGGKNGTTSYPRAGASGTGTINDVSFSEVLGWYDIVEYDGFGGIGGSITFLRATPQARVYASGYLSGITNKLVSYGKGGISRRVNSVFNDAARGKVQSQSMLSSFAAKGFDAIGHGGNWDANLQFAGTNGIVIIRYPYKLQKDI